MTSTHLTIITGASRGMGAAIAARRLQPGHSVLCISRKTSSDLADKARTAGATLVQWSQDLCEPGVAAARLEAWLREQDGPAFATATLINNAAMVTSIAALQDVAPTELSSALRVGLEAPLLLTSAFLRATTGWPCRAQGQCRVLNISSGLGRFAMASQAAYCAVKAGMDHFTRSVTLDEAARADGARIVSLAPGVIDTDMQTQLRSADPQKFPDHARFLKMKEDGQLDSPAAAAAKVLAYLDRADFGNNPIGDVRDA